MSHRCVFFEDVLDYACECGERAALVDGELVPLEPELQWALPASA